MSAAQPEPVEDVGLVSWDAQEAHVVEERTEGLAATVEGEPAAEVERSGTQTNGSAALEPHAPLPEDTEAAIEARCQVVESR